MDQLLTQIPRWLLVTILLVVGLFLIVMMNPPHTVCDSQKEIFQKDQTGFLFLDAKAPKESTTGYVKQLQTCKEGNSPGACFELFQRTRKWLDTLQSVDEKCRLEITKMEPSPIAARAIFEVFLQLAWSGKPPAAAIDKMGWLDRSHLQTFCRLQKILQNQMTDSAWPEYREQVMMSLPGADHLPRQEVWSKSILSVACADFY